MSTLLFTKSLAAVVLLFTSLLSGFAPIRTWFAKPEHTSLPIAEAFAGGIFLGVALFHMLPTAQAQFDSILGTSAYPYANLVCALGFITLLFLEKVIFHFAKTRFANNVYTISYILAVVLSVHALSEGIALGITTALANTLIIFFAIIVHKASESFALAASLARSSMRMKPAIWIFLAFSLMTPIGILIGYITNYEAQSNMGKLLEASFNSFAAGTFLYIATLHNLHHQHAHDSHNHLSEFIAVVLGLALMAVLAIWV